MGAREYEIATSRGFGVIDRSIISAAGEMVLGHINVLPPSGEQLWHVVEYAP